MNGQSLSKAFIDLPGGATAIYNSLAARRMYRWTALLEVFVRFTLRCAFAQDGKRRASAPYELTTIHWMPSAAEWVRSAAFQVEANHPLTGADQR